MLFASFNAVDSSLLLVSALAIGAASVAVISNLARFDVMALGREVAINLGVDHRRMVTITMAVMAVLVSVSTALVGPVTFFGLLVANPSPFLLTPSSTPHIADGLLPCRHCPRLGTDDP